jgi:acyl carrier protein
MQQNDNAQIQMVLKNLLTSYGLDSQQDIELLDSMSRMAFIVEIEEYFEVEMPDDFLTENLFLDITKFAQIIQSLLDGVV